MAKSKVLYVEDDEAWKLEIEDHLRRANVSVIFAEDPCLVGQKIDEHKWFDAILADVMWQDDNSNKQICRLEEVIEAVRERDLNIPIIALSEKPDAHEKIIGLEDQVFDIWGKIGGYPQFLGYRILKLVEQRQEILPEEILLYKIIDILKENNNLWGIGEILPACTEISKEMEVGKIYKRIASMFINIGYKIIKFKQTYLEEIFLRFMKTEPLDLAITPYSWGHLRHTFSVFLLGYYIINCDEINLNRERIIGEMGVESWDEVNALWFMVSAFHDTNIFWQNLPNLFKNVTDAIPDTKNKFIECIFENGGKEKSLNKKTKIRILYSIEDKKALKYILCNTNVKILNMKQEDLLKKFEHGIYGAICLQKNGKEQKISEKYLKQAAPAIMLHHYFEKEKSKMSKYINFLLELLCLVDNIQAWGRENNYEGLIETDSFKSIVLSKINVSSSGNDTCLKIDINYKPFNFFSTRDTALINLENKLIGVLRKNIDKLNILGIEKEYGYLRWRGIKIYLKFMIKGRDISESIFGKIEGVKLT